jgi:AcrR family transcriptional regulator
MGESRARGPRRDWPERRRQLLDALEELFLARGFADLTIASMAAHLHVSRGTLYLIAPTKQQLVELVVDRMFRHMGKRAHDAVESASDPAQRVAAYLGTGTATVQSGCLNFNRDLEATPGTRAIYDRHQAAGMMMLAELIHQGVGAGQFRRISPALVVQIADAAHGRLRDAAVLESLGMTHAQAIDGLISILLEGMAGDSGARPPPRHQVPTSGAVEFALGCSVEEALPLVRGVELDRTIRVLGVADGRPVRQVRDFDAAVHRLAHGGLGPPRLGQFVLAWLGR